MIIELGSTRLVIKPGGTELFQLIKTIKFTFLNKRH